MPKLRVGFERVTLQLLTWTTEINHIIVLEYDKKSTTSYGKVKIYRQEFVNINSSMRGSKLRKVSRIDQKQKQFQLK